MAESFGSGEPVSWVARRHDLSTLQLFAWRKAARDGTDAGLAAVAAAFLPVQVTEDRDDGVVGYTPLELPPLSASPDLAGSVVPFRPMEGGDRPGPADQRRSAEPLGSAGPGDGAAGLIEAVMPDGVMLRLPGDLASDRLAELVGALRTPPR